MRGAQLLGAVLAGGESRRFGRDKAAEVLAGKTLVERAAGVLAEVCAQVVIVSSRTSMPSQWPIVSDLREGQGPLGGIEAALKCAEDLGLEGVFVLACDLPLVDAATIRRVIEASAGAAACAPSRDTAPGVEPLCALYGVACREAVSRALDRGARAVHETFFAVGGRTTEVPGDLFLNLNRPDDLRRAEAVLGAR